jgi:hypothetical protein
VRTLYVLFSLARRERGGANLLLSRGLGPEGVFSWSKASARLMDPLWKWSLKSGDCGLLVMRGFLKTYPEPAGPGLFADLASDCATYRASEEDYLGTFSRLSGNLYRRGDSRQMRTTSPSGLSGQTPSGAEALTRHSSNDVLST